jgi:hypothetical protein
MSQIELVSSGKRLAQINIISGSISKQKKLSSLTRPVGAQTKTNVLHIAVLVLSIDR